MRAGCCVHTPIISYSLATTTADDKKELEPRGLVAKPKLKKALVSKFTRILRHGLDPAAEHHVSIPNRERTRWSGRVCLLLCSVHGSIADSLEVRYITNRIWNCRQPRDGWVWPVKMQRGKMRAHMDYYGGDDTN